MQSIPLPRRHAGGLVIAAAAVILLAGACDRAAQLVGPVQPPAAPGQTGPAVRIGGGAGSTAPWSGWLYPTADGACVEVVDNGVVANTSCQSGGDPFNGDVGVGSTTGDGDTWAVGSTSRPDAAMAVITTVTGETVQVPLVRPGTTLTNGNRYFMARFPKAPQVALILIEDANGRELDNYPMAPPPGAHP